MRAATASMPRAGVAAGGAAAAAAAARDGLSVDGLPLELLLPRLGLGSLLGLLLPLLAVASASNLWRRSSRSVLRSVKRAARRDATPCGEDGDKERFKAHGNDTA